MARLAKSKRSAKSQLTQANFHQLSDDEEDFDTCEVGEEGQSTAEEVTKREYWTLVKLDPYVLAV